MKIKAFFESKKFDKVKGITLFLGVLSLYLMLLISAVYLVFFNPLFYNYAFKKFDVLNELAINQSDLNRVRNNIILFFMFFKSSLQTVVTKDGTSQNFYTDLELSHMHDVRGFFIFFLIIIIISVLLLSFSGLYYLYNKKKYDVNKKVGLFLIIIPSVFIAFLSLIGIFIALDFDKAFTLFHEIFFPQGNWEFENSLMITLLPEGLFLDGAIIILSLMLTFSFISTIFGVILYIKAKKRHKTLAESIPSVIDEIEMTINID